MPSILTQSLFPVLLTILAALSASSASAHLMPSGRGSLNVTDSGVYMILTLPMSAFEGSDENGDGSVSIAEFNKHRSAIIERMEHAVWLEQGGERLSPKHVMLDPQTSHAGRQSGVFETTILARFPRNADSPLPAAFGLSAYGPEGEPIEFRASHRALGLTSTFTVSADAERGAIAW